MAGVGWPCPALGPFPFSLPHKRSRVGQYPVLTQELVLASHAHCSQAREISRLLGWRPALGSGASFTSLKEHLWQKPEATNTEVRVENEGWGRPWSR